MKIDTQKIINRLRELKDSFNALKKEHHENGDERFESNREVLKRIIDRTYPEKDAKEIKEKLVHRFWAITRNESDEYWQKFYLDKINLSICVIDTILEESELFGFEDFKPLKEKVETEIQIGSSKIGFWRKKKTK